MSCWRWKFNWNAKSGILIEQSTGEILFSKDKDRRLSPASMTKIMTLLLIYEAMDNGQFDKNTILITSKYAASMGGSQVYLKENEKISVDEAIKCKETGEEKTIVMNFSGHGMLDLKGYASYFEGTMQNAK